MPGNAHIARLLKPIEPRQPQTESSSPAQSIPVTLAPSSRPFSRPCTEAAIPLQQPKQSMHETFAPLPTYFFSFYGRVHPLRKVVSPQAAPLGHPTCNLRIAYIRCMKHSHPRHLSPFISQPDQRLGLHRGARPLPPLPRPAR